jgi:S-adenosylmethionine uptake transporter
MTSNPSNLRGALLALLSFGIFSASDVIVKYMGASYSPFQNIFFSTLFGFPMVAMLLMSDRREENLIPHHLNLSLLRAALVVVNALAGFYAFAVLPLSEAYPIFFSAPLMITLFAIPMLGEKVGLHRGIAVAVGLVGVIVVVRPGAGHFGLGHAAALLAAMIYAVNSILLRRMGQSERSVVIMLYPMLANFVVTGLALPFVYKPLPIEHMGLLAAMSVTGFVAGLIMIAAYRRAPAVIVAPMQYSQIIWGVIFGAIFFAETADVITFLGTAIIIASGVYIVQREGKPDVSRNRPVTEARAAQDMGQTARLSSWRRIFDRRPFRAAQYDDPS